MMISELEAIASPVITSLGLKCYGCEFSTQPRGVGLVIYIDGPNGVTIDDCANVSRQVAAVLDVEDPVSGRYQLEVSSPGVNRPLFKIEHYSAVIGKKVKFKLRQAYHNRRHFVGTLKDVVHTQLVFVLEETVDLTSDLTVDFSEIEKARLVADL